MKLSANMLSMLFKLFNSPGHTRMGGSTQRTLSALEKRGLTEFEVVPTRRLSVRWRLTEAGLAEAESRWGNRGG